MRIALMILSFIPFLHYGIKDNAFHFRGRKVSGREHLLHVGIGMCQAIMFIQAVRSDFILMFGAMLLLLVAGGIDEYVFHRDLPPIESDLHAKQHFALFIFVVISLATTWLEKRNWEIPALFPHSG
jgi:hypothetical protein